MTPTPPPLTHSLAEQIAARLSDRIVAGGYTPGQRIMEQALAEEFSVSRGPVREALRLLEKDGLVTILPRRGAQVTRLSIDEVKEIFDVRAMLNGLRDRLVAESPDRQALLPQIEAEVDALTRYARDTRHADVYIDTVFKLNRILTEARAADGSRPSSIRSRCRRCAIRSSDSPRPTGASSPCSTGRNCSKRSARAMAPPPNALRVSASRTRAMRRSACCARTMRRAPRRRSAGSRDATRPPLPVR